MSFRTTVLLFGLLLAVIWAFGLMLALRRSALDEGLIAPKLAKADIANVDEVDITKDGKTYTFRRDPKKDEHWRVKFPNSQDQYRADDVYLKDLINEIQSAKHSNEDVPELTRNPSQWGLDNPKVTVTVRDTSLGTEATVSIGNESPDNAFVYVMSSERPRQVLAVKRGQLAKLFFGNINDLRPARLLEVPNKEDISRIELEQKKDGKLVSGMEFVKTKEGLWRFKKPNYGPADYEGVPGADKETGVRGLLTAIMALRADTFEPPGGVTVTPEQSLVKIDIEYEVAKGKPAKKETLLIGGQVAGRAAGKEQYFARVLSDNSVVHVDAKWVEPILNALKDPPSLRSHDLAQFAADKVDAIILKRGDEEVRVYRTEGAEQEMPDIPGHPKMKGMKGEGGWMVYATGLKPHKGSPQAIGDRAALDPELGGGVGLLTGLLGKREVTNKDFDVKEPEKKFDPKNILATVKVYIDSLAPEEKKKDDKKDEKKDGKKDEKKDDKAKDNKDQKKDDKKEEKPEPKFKSDAKAAVTLTFAKVAPEDRPVAKDKEKEKDKDKDKEKEKDRGPLVLVKREAPDTDTMYFYIPESAFEKAVPPNLPLALFDTEIRPFEAPDAIKLTVVRGRGKDQETFELERDLLRQGTRREAANVKDEKDKLPPIYSSEWRLRKPAEFADKGDSGSPLAARVIGQLANLNAVRWVKKTKNTAELDEFGLESPEMVVTVEFKAKDEKDKDKEKPKPFVLKVGNRALEVEGSREGYYAIVEGNDLVFVIDLGLYRMLRDQEFRNQTAMKFEPAKVKELRVWLKVTKDEIPLGPVVFQREGEKNWKLVKGADLRKGVNSKRVEDALAKMADLRVDRYLTAKTALPEFKLGDKARIILEAEMEDGKTYKLWIGAPKDPDDHNSPLYGECSERKGVIFLVRRDLFEPAFKLAYFGNQQ
jgi:hypothetical protein